MVFSGSPSTEELLKDAVKLKFTNNGEIFSAQWLLDTLKQNFASTLKPDKTRAYLFTGELDSDFIKEKLKQHCLILVPYDSDHNHAPTNVHGHRAHWCLLCGYLVEDNNDVSSMKNANGVRLTAKFSLQLISRFPFNESLKMGQPSSQF